MKKSVLLAGLSLALGVQAGSYQAPAPEPMNWHLMAGVGYTVYQNMLKNDGQTSIKRIALQRDFWRTDRLVVGLEVGAQDGNQMRTKFSQDKLDVMGGEILQATTTPVLDLLATFDVPLSMINQGSTTFLKAGIAYRQMHFGRTAVNDLQKINFEFQAGLSAQVSERASLAIAYQGIFSSKPTLTTYGVAPVGRGRVKNIPSQNGVLLTFSVAV